METTNEKITKASGLYREAMKAAYNAVREYVIENGNFIDTRNTERNFDGLYAYVYDEDFTIHEHKVMAIRYKDENLEILTAEQSRNIQVIYSREDMDCSEDWISLDGTEDRLYTSTTLLGMLDVITEYGNNN